MRLRRNMMADSSGGSYNSIITAMSPSIWWRLENTSGIAATDSSGGGRNGSLQGGATFATAGIPAPSGGAGLGRGCDMGAASATQIVNAVAGPPGVLFGGGSTSSWTVGIVTTGQAATGYLACRQNNAAIIHNFVAGQVEFFATGYSGSDPRTGSQIPLSNVDTTVPHLIVYRYDNGQWSGLLDGVEIFNVARSFGCLASHATIYVGNDGGTSVSNSKVYDFWVVNSAVPTATIAAAWAARNNP